MNTWIFTAFVELNFRKVYFETAPFVPLIFPAEDAMQID